MGRKNRNRADEFLFGGRNNADNNNFVDPAGFDRGQNDVETIVSPTETVVNPTTTRRTVRQVHPTHVVNVNRNITRVENYYPVKESEKNINIIEEYDCGSDLHHPCCKPRKHCN
jgi:spore coat protein D